MAAAVPLAYAADPLPSPIQTPVDVLGEVTAAGLLAAALVVLHRRPWLAGLLVGLAIQTKFIALLAIPAFAVAALLDAPGSSVWQRMRAGLPRVLAAAGLAAAPTFVYEVVKFLSLGPEAGIENLRNFGWFLLGGGQFGYQVPPIDKLNVFIGAWHLPAWVAARAHRASVRCSPSSGRSRSCDAEAARPGRGLARRAARVRRDRGRGRTGTRDLPRVVAAVIAHPALVATSGAAGCWCSCPW